MAAQPKQKRDFPNSITALLENFGISAKSVQQFRFGGIVGKVALVALAGLAATATGLKFTAGWAQIACLVVLPLVTLVVIRWIIDYADRHPWSATLEGAEALVWQQQQVMIAAQGITAPPEAPQIASPFVNPKTGSGEDTKELEGGS